MRESSILLLGSDLVFVVVFGVFVIALAALAIVALRWGIRSDRPKRIAWQRRLLEQANDGTVEGEQSDGHVPDQRSGRRLEGP